jgi:hypothetical protein
MKMIYTCLLCCTVYQLSYAQDSTSTWQPSISVDAEPVPTLSVSRTNDTSYHNSLSIMGIFTIRHRSGFGISYAPGFVCSSSGSQLYVQRLTLGFEQYDQPACTWVADYTHDFFAAHSSLPYIPLNNEGYALFKYKKWFLQPVMETDIGWGKDSAMQGKTNYDLNFAAGIAHAFHWQLGQATCSLTPSVLANMGTDSYFFLSRVAKYISHNKGFIKYLKNPHYAGSKLTSTARHPGNNFSIQDSSATTQVSSGINRMQFNNIAAETEVNLSWLSWTLRADVEAFIPVSAATGNSISAYWSLTCEYDF